MSDKIYECFPSAWTCEAPLQLVAEKLLMFLKRKYKKNNFYIYGHRHEIAEARSKGHISLTHNEEKDLYTALDEAFYWLLTNGYVRPDPEQSSGAFAIFTKKAREIESTEDFQTSVDERLLPAENLHSRFPPAVHMNFMAGEYSIAIATAMKQVEIEVRDLSGINQNGVSLMREAFHKTNGPLTDKSADPGEIEGTSALFAGAMALLRNPHSHRQVEIKTALEAVEALMTANLLMRIIDTRRLKP